MNNIMIYLVCILCFYLFVVKGMSMSLEEITENNKKTIQAHRKPKGFFDGLSESISDIGEVLN